jgi:hypothetical protein
MRYAPSIYNVKKLTQFSTQTRSAFTRILATTGSYITHLIPLLMTNLLAHFEPTELIDFMTFIGLLVHRLQVGYRSSTGSHHTECCIG